MININFDHELNENLKEHFFEGILKSEFLFFGNQGKEKAIMR